MPRIAPLLALSLSAVLAALAPLASQPPDRTFEGTAEVIEVEVPVAVVGRDGEPIRGLTVDQFELFDNGKRQEITQLRVVDLELIEPDRSRLEIERSIPPTARRHFLLLFDLSFSKPTSVVRAREAAREFALNRLHPTDLAAVATHTVEGGGRMLVTFTPDRAQVVRAIDTLGAPRLLQLARKDPLRFLIDDPGLSGFQASRELGDRPGSGGASQIQNSVFAHVRAIAKLMAKSEKGFHRGRISSWSRSMADLAQMMNSVQGRKYVVYFSEGFDGRLLFGRTPSADDPAHQEDLLNIQLGQHWAVDSDDLYGNTGLQVDVNLMLEEFRRADCVIHSVDISGLTADLPQEERNRDATQAALFYIADDTGGELFQDANEFGDQLGRMLERTSVTYLLTFRPAAIESDGSFHRLKIKGDFPRGARLSFRQGYFAPKPYETLHPVEKSLLASDAIASLAPKREVELDVLAAPFPAGDAKAYIPLIIEIGGESLLRGHEGAGLPVEVYAYASDGQGQMKDFFTQMVTLDLSRNRDAFVGSGLKYYGHLDLEPGEYLVRVLVRNAVTGRTGVETVPLLIPAYDRDPPFLLPPFFVDEGQQWFLVREASGQEYRPTVVYPFTVNGEPFIPAVRPRLRSDREARICLVAYNLGAGELLVDGSIVAEDGRRIEADSLALAERTVTGIEGLEKLIATFRPEGLEAGSYQLEVALRNPDTGRSETNSIAFTLGYR